VQERRGRGDRSKSQEGPDVADAPDQLSTAQRSNQDADRTNLRRHEALDPAANAQQGACNVLPICMSPKPRRSASKVGSVARCTVCIGQLGRAKA
jgi:hypothetical protein